MNISDLVMWIVLPLLGVSILIAFVRLLYGPSVPDRVVALDVMSSLAIAFIACYAVGVGEPAFLDIAVVLALLAFLSTVAFAYYLERQVR